MKILIFEGNRGKNSYKSINNIENLGKYLIESNKDLITDSLSFNYNDNQKLYQDFGVKSQCIYLIRPDGHVGLRCEPIDLDIINGYLKERLKSKNSNLNSKNFQPKESFDFLPFLLIFLIILAFTYSKKIFNMNIFNKLK
jgi:hypothetical protein